MSAFLLDVGEANAVIRHVEDHWLARLEELELDDRSLEAAERSLDRAAYKAEQAARTIRGYRRRHASTLSSTVDEA